MRRRFVHVALRVFVVGLVIVASAAVSLAQPAAAPLKPWTQSVSLGLATTQGNRDTTTFNAGYEITFDAQRRHRIRTDGLLLRGSTEGQLTADRLQLNGRDEYRVSGTNNFVFGQFQYVRDPFKNIQYLMAPTAGIGVRPVDTPATRLSFDVGLGGVWEKRPLAEIETSGALTYAEKITKQLTATTTFVQSLTALHKTADFGDALFTFNASIALAMTTRTQVKVEVIDNYKVNVTGPGVVNNDAALLVGLVYKN
jgi:putative salt-induced outer membrane protein YdiY